MDKYPVLKFDSLKHLQSEVKANDWDCSRKNTDRKWRYGNYFDTYDTHMEALNHGRTTPTLLAHYKKIRKLLESKVKVSNIKGMGMSCKRKRRFVDDGDEVDIDRYLTNSDTPWSITKRNKKAKRIVLAINYALSHSNNEASYAKVVSAGAFLADVLNKLGYAVEIIGTCSSGYNGSEDYKSTCVAITFKESGRKLDIQRILSMGLSGLHRALVFGIREKLWKNDSTMGYQQMMPTEIKDKLGISYVVQQEIVNDEKKMIDEFQKVIAGLVEKRDARTWQWL